MSVINFPILYIPDPTKGRPLFNGDVYVGIPDLDPTIEANQKDLRVIQEDGTVVPVDQPFKLSAGGVPVYNGSPVRLDVEGNYSIKINDRLGSQIYYMANVDKSLSIVIEKRKLVVVEDQLIYPLPVDVLNVSAVIASKQVLHETDSAYSVDITAGTLTLSEGLAAEEILEIWVSAIPAPSLATQGFSGAFAFASTAAASDLTEAEEFVTLDGLVLDDNFGATWGKTGLVNAGKAGTVEVGTGSLYDVNGKQFKQIGENITLESLGLAYTETAADVATRIFDLRQNGFVVEINPLYEVTEVNRAFHVRYNDWEVSVHRGWALVNVENTQQAFTNSVSIVGEGVNTSIEMDVQITSDGIPVVFHDDTVDALTDGTGTIASMTFAQVRLLTLDKSSPTIFADKIRIPTFDRVVQVAARSGVKVIPEIKQYRTVADIELMSDVIQKYGYSDNCVWTSFQVSDLQELRKYDTQSQIGWAANNDTTQLPLLKAIEGPYPAIIFRSDGALAATPSLVDLYSSYGFDTMAFTSNLARDIQTLADIKVRKVFADENL